MEPILIRCEAYACKECINRTNKLLIPCYKCNGTHEKKDLVNLPISEFCENMIKYHLNDLIQYVEGTLKILRSAAVESM